MNKPKALFIVEGEAAEKKTVNALVRCLGEISNLNIQMVSVGSNVTGAAPIFLQNFPGFPRGDYEGNLALC